MGENYAHGDLTAVVAAFERPRCLRLLLRSLKQHTPDIPLIVVDQTAREYVTGIVEEEGMQATVLRPGFDKGIGFCRNLYLEAVDTPMFLNLDEDFILPDAEIVPKLLAPVRKGMCDICAGTLGDREAWCDNFFFENGKLIQRPVRQVAALTSCDITHAFFVANTEKVRDAGGWDAKQKGWDHIPFFITAKIAGLRVAYRKGCTVIHNRIPYKDGKSTMARRFRLCERWLADHGLKAWEREGVEQKNRIKSRKAKPRKKGKKGRK